MSGATRRGFLAGAAAGVGLPALARADSSHSLPAKQKRVFRGRAIAAAGDSGLLVVAHDQRRTISVVRGGRKHLIDVGGEPLEVAVSPDGHTAAVTTASWDQPGLAIVDLRRKRVAARIDVGPAPFGVAWSRDGARVFVGGGEEEGEVVLVDPRRRKLVARTSLAGYPKGVAAGRDGAWIALNARRRIAFVSGRTGRVERTVRTPALPDRVAVSPDGGSLLVSHGGLDSERVSELDLASKRLKHHAAGRLPSGVAWGPRGRRLVALGGAGEILEIAPGGRRSHHRVGGAPRGVAVAGGRAFTVDALTGAVARVRL